MTFMTGKQPLPSDLLVETLGILANLVIPSFDYLKLVNSHPLLPFIVNRISGKYMETEDEDDIVLECLQVVHTICQSEEVAIKCVEEGLCTAVLGVLIGK